MATVLELATAELGGEHAVYMVFFQGCPFVYTNDRSGDLHGSGWIGGGDGRSVKPGLVDVPSFRYGIDEESLQLENHSITLRILDHDGTLADSMGKEPDEADIKRLAETLGAGSSSLSTTAIKTGWDSNNKTADNPRGKHIGVERIGPSGERNHWYPMPFTHPGPQHFVDEGGGEKPLVTVTDDPVVWEGRLVTVYRIWRDTTSTATGAAAWPSWSDHHDSGVSLVWVGRLRSQTRIGAGDTWELSVSGHRALIEKTLNNNAPTEWLDVSPLVVLGTDTGQEENEIAVGFRSIKADDPFNAADEYEYSKWAPSNDLASDTPENIAAAINTAIQNAASGVNTTHRLSEETFGSERDHAVSFSIDGVRIKSQNYIGTDTRVASMVIGLHEKVWKACGFDPAVQSALPSDHTLWLQVLGNGEEELEQEPARPGYIYVRFDTKPPGAGSSNYADWDSNGAGRRWPPMSEVGGSPIEASGDQDIEVRAPNGSRIYLDGQNFLPPYDGDVDGSTADATRLFAFRGTIARIENGATIEEEITQVAKVSWVDDPGFPGSIKESTNNTSAYSVRIERWFDPRVFGFSNPSLAQLGISVWMAPGLRCIPLGTFTYAENNAHEYTSPSVMSLLVSTGTSTGWTSQTAPDFGDNDPADRITSIGGDRWSFDFGLGLPESIVASERSVQDAFDAVAGGWTGPLNRHRLATIGPIEASEVLASLMEVGGCGWSLHGGNFGVFNLYDVPAPDAVDVTITDADLGGRSSGDHIPDQHDVVLGRFKRAKLAYRHVPGKTGTAHERVKHALDRAAVNRPPIERDLVALGLPHRALWDRDGSVPNYVPAWETDFGTQWGRVVAEFWGHKNVVLEVNLRQHIGVQVWPGTTCLFTSAWPHNPVTGSRGITQAVGRVLRAERHSHGFVRARILIYGETLRGVTASPHYAPAALTDCGYNPSTRQIHVQADPWRVGDNTLSSVRGFVKPSWASALADADAKIKLWELKRDRTVAEGPTAFVESVDEAGNTITITSAGWTGTYRQSARYLVTLASLTDVQQAAWAVALYAPITDANGEYDGGASTGSPWLVP